MKLLLRFLQAQSDTVYTGKGTYLCKQVTLLHLQHSQTGEDDERRDDDVLFCAFVVTSQAESTVRFRETSQLTQKPQMLSAQPRISALTVTSSIYLTF